MTATPRSPLVAFFEGAPDGRGRTHAEIVAFDDAAIEARHDFIQWLFPLPEPSAAVPGSPVLCPADREAIAGSAAAQARFAEALARMIRFYQGTDRWLRPSDHNHLRITRIIRSTRLLLGDEAANHFREVILDRVAATSAPVNHNSLKFWSES